MNREALGQILTYAVTLLAGSSNHLRIFGSGLDLSWIAMRSRLINRR
jgi:hypothetical protein